MLVLNKGNGTCLKWGKSFCMIWTPTSRLNGKNLLENTRYPYVTFLFSNALSFSHPVDRSRPHRIDIPLQETLKNNLTDSLEDLFKEADDKTWSAVRELLQRETESAVSQYSTALSWFELDKQAMRDCARAIVEEKARQKAKMVFTSMKTRLALCLPFSC